MKWIDVSESLPDRAANVLIWMERDAWKDGKRCRKSDIGIGWQIEGRWHVDGCSDVVGLYWMPLPEPPEGEQYEYYD